jgi:D-serine deaminase-like pyridoxal phosphate-dependent protein
MTETLEQIDTPALLVDAVHYEQNIKSCLEYFVGTGVTVRPHLKTANLR